MFLKDSPPATRKQNIRFGICCAVMITLAAVVLGEDRWAAWSITNALKPGQPAVAEKPYFELKRISVAIGNCSPEHFWGSAIMYWDEKEPSPEGYTYSGRVCRDWWNGGWVFIARGGSGWKRYWVN